MAHKVETMAYAGEKPWHGLGVEVPASIGVDEMVRRAGLEWRVELVPVYAMVPKDWRSYNSDEPDALNSNKYVRNPDKYALIRTSDNRIFSTVGDRYKPIQNRDAFEIFNDYVRAGQMRLETAGSLKDGLIIWGLASINDGFTLAGGDTVKGYLLLSQSHEYGQSMRVMWTSIRVVCWNTLMAAFNDQSAATFTMSHSRRFDDAAIEQVKRTLGIARGMLSEYGDKAKFLAGVEFSEQKGIEFLMRALQKTENKLLDEKMIEVPKSIDAALTSEHVKPGTREVLRIVHTQPGADLKSGGNSAWNWFNALTFTTDHLMGRGADTRLQSAWFGPNARLKTKALDLALEMASNSNLKNRAA